MRASQCSQEYNRQESYPSKVTRDDCDSEESDEAVPETITSRRSSGLLASFAAIGAAVLASSCCLPLFPFLAAAGAAGSSAFFVKLRPFLLLLSIALISWGFYQGWRAKKCNRTPSILSTILLWLSAFIVVSFTLFPQVIANLMADLAAK